MFCPQNALLVDVKYVGFDGEADYAIRPTVNGKMYVTNGKDLTHYQYDGTARTAILTIYFSTCKGSTARFHHRNCAVPPLARFLRFQ